MVKNEALVFCELKLAGERQLIKEQTGIFWAMPNLSLNDTRKRKSSPRNLAGIRWWCWLWKPESSTSLLVMWQHQKYPASHFYIACSFAFLSAAMSCLILFLIWILHFQQKKGSILQAFWPKYCKILKEEVSLKLSRHVSLGWHKVKC